MIKTSNQHYPQKLRMSLFGSACVQLPIVLHPNVPVSPLERTWRLLPLLMLPAIGSFTLGLYFLLSQGLWGRRKCVVLHDMLSPANLKGMNIRFGVDCFNISISYTVWFFTVRFHKSDLRLLLCCLLSQSKRRLRNKNKTLLFC